MRPMKTGVMLVILGLAGPVAAATAQGTAPAPGDRVRVNVCERGTAGTSCAYLIGSFVSWTPDRIVLRDSLGRDVQVTAGPRSVLEVSRGKYSPMAQGLVYGLLGGAAFGGILTFACAQDAGEDAGMCAGLVPIGAGVGAMLGGLAGAMSDSERWRSAARPDGVTIAPSPQGMRIGFSRSF